MKKQFKTNMALKVVFSLLLPILYAVIQVFYKGQSPIVFLWMALLVAPVYSFFSMHVSLFDDELQLGLSVPKKVILKQISYRNIISIDGHKNFFFMNFYIRAQSAGNIHRGIISHIFDTSENVLILSPIISNRRDLLKTLLERNPAVKVDALTTAFLSRTG